MGRAASAQTYPVSRSGWYWYPCRRNVGQGIPAANRAFRPTSSPLPNCGTAEGVPTSRAAPGELTRRQARGKTTPAGGASRPPDRNPGLSAHIKPSARAHQAEGAGCISPPAALAAVGLPGCRRAGGQSMKHSPSILQRGRLSRPCRRRSLSAAALRGRHGIRHPSCKPDWVRRARTGRQPAAAPLRAASGGRRVPLFLPVSVWYPGPAHTPGSRYSVPCRPGIRPGPGGRCGGTDGGSSFPTPPPGLHLKIPRQGVGAEILGDGAAAGAVLDG